MLLRPTFKGYKGFADQALPRAHTHTHVCCRSQGCTQGPKFYQGVADQVLLRAYTCVLQNASLGGCTQGSSSPDQLLLRACTCVLKNKKQGAANARKVTRVQPKGYCGKHTHVCCRTIKLRVSHKGQRLQRIAHHLLLRGHTHVGCRINQCRVAPRAKVYVYALQRRGRPIAAASIHMSVAPEDQGLQGVDRPIAAASAHTHTCELQKTQIQGCTRGSRVTKVWPTMCCCEHTHCHTLVAE